MRFGFQLLVLTVLRQAGMKLPQKVDSKSDISCLIVSLSFLSSLSDFAD